jgi:short-subunit dehydrogenase
MISEGYVTNGATVYISSRDAKACEKAAQELNALGMGKAHAIPADFYKEEDIKKLAEELAKRESSKLLDQYMVRIRSCFAGD